MSAFMPEAQIGDTVQVHYTGKLEDGSVFDSSQDREPLTFTLGQGQVIPGFESIVVGMNEGEAATKTVPVEEAYGPRREDLLMEVPKAQLPPDLEPEVGQVLEVQGEGGQRAQVFVADVGEEAVTLDGNHPLAGKDLVFEIELVAIGNEA